MSGIILPEEHPRVEEPEPIKKWILVLSTFLVVCSLLLYGTIFFAVPPFGELFAEFGTDLPVLTALVIDYSRYTVLFAFIGVVPLVSMWRYRFSGSPSTSRDFILVIASFGIALIVCSITFAGVYLPVFKMGVVVGS